MDAAQRFHYADFTYDNYRRLIRLAKQSYVFRTFDQFSPDERFALWRHDVDLSMHAARNLARIETDEGVVATYLLQLHSEFYNLFEADVVDCVREIIAGGHRLGLHFDSHFYGIESAGRLDEHLRRERDVIAGFFGRPVDVFSFHKTTPFTMSCRDWQYGGMINAYADYFQTQVGYCSDSNGYWRHRRLEDVVVAASDPRLHVLTHDGWWQAEAMSPRRRLLRCIEGRAARTLHNYEETMRTFDRLLIDDGEETRRDPAAA